MEFAEGWNSGIQRKKRLRKDATNHNRKLIIIDLEELSNARTAQRENDGSNDQRHVIRK